MPLTRLPLSLPEALTRTMLLDLNRLSYLAGALLPLPPLPSWVIEVSLYPPGGIFTHFPYT